MPLCSSWEQDERPWNPCSVWLSESRNDQPGGDHLLIRRSCRTALYEGQFHPPGNYKDWRASEKGKDKLCLQERLKEGYMIILRLLDQCPETSPEQIPALYGAS